jgi:signal transduction histidine kinase
VPLPDGATLITFSDVTAVKQFERALLERNEALVAADKLKNQFIGHVSYELRTPLTNIIGFGELLSSPRTGNLNTKQREYVGDILGSSTTLLSIIDDILDLATIDAGALELKQSNVSAKAIAEQAALGVRDRAARARIKVEVNVPEKDLTLVADESRVRQMLYNLASNAIGFSKPGGRVSITAATVGPMVEFTVTDDGVGIPHDQLTRVFERFESRSIAAGRQRGTGLGLSLVKSLVDLHGGELHLASEPGRGTRVTVRLPKNGVPAQPEDRALARA